MSLHYSLTHSLTHSPIFSLVLTPFAAIVLREIPFSVLLGVFLYLMYASFSGIQLRKRIKLLFTPPKHHPDIHYVRKVPATIGPITCVPTLTHALTHSCTHSLTCSLTHLLTHLHTHSLTYTLTHLLTHLHTHSLTYTLTLQVRTWKMNIYTVIQVVLIAALYGLKLSPAGMLYPLAIVLLIPIRMFMERFMYNHKEFEAVSKHTLSLHTLSPSHSLYHYILYHHHTLSITAEWRGGSS